MFKIVDTSIKNKKGLTEEQFLKSYNPDKYPKPSVTVDMVIFTFCGESDLKIMMIKRGDHPYINQWALPGGFVSVDESIDDAAKRELKEETNIDNVFMEQLYTWGDVGRDPRMRVISCSYIALVDSSQLNVKAGDDAQDAGWFSVGCKKVYEDKITNEDGYIIEKHINIELKNKNILLSSKIKITETVKGKAVRINREIIESNGIAFDHGKIIQYGVEKLQKLKK